MWYSESLYMSLNDEKYFETINQIIQVNKSIIKHFQPVIFCFVTKYRCMYQSTHIVIINK